jgi:hypothetical protein
MIMSPRLRKFALTAHISLSVGWLGTVAVFLALGIIGLISQDTQTVQAAYLVMEPAGWFVLLPLAFASLITGIIQSVGSTWGLFRHHWVLLKLAINVFANIVLLIYMQTLTTLASLAADPNMDLKTLRDGSPLDHAVLALLLLVVATGLAVYKPRAMTRYGWRKQHEQRTRPQPALSQP